MTIDVYIIILTAFAVFGFYSFIELIVSWHTEKDLPPSAVVMKYSDDEKTYIKRRYINNTVNNNSIILVSDENVRTDMYPGCTVCKECEISRAVSQRLFTKKAD
ncbi:MAG: hypothetical protein IJ410_08305 [Oscillospiraceae bacterium]|nr:hypothetical protein [Oscillospiraceae bacterium]